MGSWLVFLFVAIVVIAGITWLLMDDAIIKVNAGELGLVMADGRATDRVLQPGLRWVPAFRRRMVEIYPSLELAYRAGGLDGVDDDAELERSGPTVKALLGDRSAVAVSYTVRFRLDPERLRYVHERFGPDGLWSVVRDLSGRTVRSALNDPKVKVDDVFGAARQKLDQRVADAVAAALGPEGFVVSSVSLTDLDLGRTGDTVQATVRARFELEREQAEAAMRLERARADAELAPYASGASLDAALRYREADAWRDVAHALAQRPTVLPPATRRSGGEPTLALGAADDAEAADEVEGQA